MMDKQKVLFVVDEQMYGGVSIVLRNILKSINYAQCEVDVLILHNRGDAIVGHIPEQVGVLYGTSFFEVIDTNIQTILKSGNMKNIISKLKLVYAMKHKKIEKYIQKERGKILTRAYDVEIAFKDGFCALFTACGESNKKVSWLHIDYNTYDCTGRYRELFQEVYKRIDTVVAITQDVQDTFNDIYHCEDKCIILPNLIDSHEIIEQSKQEEIYFPKDRTNFICVGRLAPQKAYPRLLTQLGKLKQEHILTNEIVHIIGDGEQQAYIEELIHQYHLEENIELLGYKQNPYPYICKADMLLLPSLYEGLGLVLYEALILKVPCLATKIADIHTTLENGKYGIITENSDEGVYKALKTILQDKTILQTYKQAVSQYVYKQQEKVVEKLDRLLET